MQPVSERRSPPSRRSSSWPEVLARIRWHDVDELQGQTNPRADFDRLPTMAQERLPGCSSYLTRPSGEGISNFIFSPGWETSGDPEAWGQFDGLFVLLHDADGELLGNLSIDEPISGRRPPAAGCRPAPAPRDLRARGLRARQCPAHRAGHRDGLHPVDAPSGLVDARGMRLDVGVAPACLRDGRTSSRIRARCCLPARRAARAAAVGHK